MTARLHRNFVYYHSTDRYSTWQFHVHTTMAHHSYRLWPLRYSCFFDCRLDNLVIDRSMFSLTKWLISSDRVVRVWRDWPRWHVSMNTSTRMGTTRTGYRRKESIHIKWQDMKGGAKPDFGKGTIHERLSWSRWIKFLVSTVSGCKCWQTRACIQPPFS